MYKDPMEVNVWELFSKKRPEMKERWLHTALEAQERPSTLQQRNFQQLMLAERYRAQFQLDPLDALRDVALVFGKKFPH